jgi:hypothetical protein
LVGAQSSGGGLSLTRGAFIQAGITEDELYTHTTEKHADAGQVRMVCPICAVRPSTWPPLSSPTTAT